MKIIALRIDVDTYRGTKHGVPALCSSLARWGIKGTFYFSVGPDNMGRHLWRLLKPKFLWKMLRTDAAGLYGLDILLMGTAWPGPQIGKRLGPVIKAAADAGHEIGLHAWDHHHDQAAIDRMSPEELLKNLTRGFNTLKAIVGSDPVTSATPGWRCNDQTLEAKAKLPFRYNSDCRGTHIFRPVVNGKALQQLQVPVTLPTYDEMLGRNGVTNENYNDRLFELLQEDRPNILTIHAEAEGGKCNDMFNAFLDRAINAGWTFKTLGELAAEAGKTSEVPLERILPLPFPGREGWLAVQSKLEPQAGKGEL